MADAFDVIAGCARARVARGAPGAGDLSGVDAEAIVALARDHGMLGLLADQCRRDDRRDGPWGRGRGAVIRTAIEAAWREDVPESLLAAQAAARVSAALADAGLQALAYKGPALALTAYGDASLRSSEDIDIVVAPDACDRAAAALGQHGYASADGLPWREARARAAWLGHVLMAGPDGIPVELHWRFCGRKLPWSLPVPDVLGRARLEVLAGRSLLVPEPHDAVVLLYLHAARHGWDRLEAILAPAVLMARGIDADVLLTRAAAARGVRAVLTGVELARRTMDLAVPDALQRAIRADHRIRPLTDDAARRLRRGSAGTARDARLHLALLDRPADRLRYRVLAAVDPTPEDYRALALPHALRGLYFVARPVRLALRRAVRR